VTMEGQQPNKRLTPKNRVFSKRSESSKHFTDQKEYSK
jgi:hypothetical protein